MIMEKALNKEFWENIKTNPEFATYRKTILKEYNEKKYDGAIPTLKFAPRMRFYSDGNRSEFEIEFFRRRNYLASAAILALVSDDEKYIHEVEEIIWAICDEYSWVVPAHTLAGTCDVNTRERVEFPTLYQRDTSKIDLFAAETAFALAEIRYVLGDRLDERIRERILIEIKKRILDNYDRYVFWWENATNNWAAVCAGNVGSAILYAFPEEFPKYQPRILKTLESFLTGFPNDGTCLEGVTYWQYGFGEFVWFADILYQHTNGEINLFDNPKVERIAGYVRRSILRGSTTVTFSDCGDAVAGKIRADAVLISFLKDKFPGSPIDIPEEFKTFVAMNTHWKMNLREAYYHADKSSTEEFKPQDYFLKDAGQVIINREKYSLAAKAGSNGEPHNHNDVGNFIISNDDGQIIWDVGAATYTRQYFEDEHRYNFFTTSSRGHNLPIINGQYQKPGWQQRGTIDFDGENISIDFQNAYRIEGLNRLNRQIKCFEDKVVLTDSFDIKYDSFVERFISITKPEISKDEVTIGNLKIKFDSEKCSVAINEESYEAHAIKARVSNSRLVYCVDFTLVPDLDSVTFEFVI